MHGEEIDWEGFFEEQVEKTEKQKQAVEWGRLGGRPPIKVGKLEHRLHVRISKEQKEKLEKFSFPPQVVIRYLLDNAQVPAPNNAETNKALIQSVTNLTRLSNFFRAGIWDEATKKKFTSELSEMLAEIKKNLQK